jgi:peptidoglycan/LPS O-acetylase OafA/YrhL
MLAARYALAGMRRYCMLRSNRIDSLTSLRFIAASMIVVHHSRGVLWLGTDSAKSLVLDQGVCFFFVLSGFILTYVYPNLNRPSATRQFLLARFARIWPAHAFTFSILFLIFVPWSWYLLKTANNSWITLTNLFMIHGWIPIREYFFSCNAVSWSISTELFFYLVFPFLIKSFETTWHLKLLCSILLVVGLIVFCNIAQIPSNAGASSDAITRSGILYINPLARQFEFVLGMCVALLWGKSLPHSRICKKMATLLEIAAVCLVVLSLHLSLSVNALDNLIGPAGSEYLIHASTAVFFAGLIYIVALQRGLVSQALSGSFFVLLGEISFSIYLWHQIILRIYTDKAKWFADVPQPLLYILFWIFLLFISWLTWRLVEKPCRRFMLSYGSRSVSE